MLKKCQKEILIGLFLFLLACLVLGNRFEVHAAAGSLTILLDDLGTPMDNVGFSVYQVGSLNAQGAWELTEPLRDKGVELNSLNYASQWDAAASRLAYLVQTQGLQGKIGVTDSSGQMNMEGLAEGMYLVVQHEGKTYGDISPFLVSVPCQDGEAWTDDVTVYPKSSYTPDEEKGKITVTMRTTYLDMSLMEIVDLLPTDVTYYVGIFLDDQGTVPYGDDYIRPIRMQKISKGTAVFENLPKGTYYIFETDKYGNRVDLDTFPYLVSGEQKAELSEGNSEADITIVNTIKENGPETFSSGELQVEEQPEDENGITDLSDAGATADSPKTGDDTDAGIFLLMAALAVMAGGAAAGLRRKKESL